MPDMTSCTFTVNDQDGGADTRSFAFNTTQQGGAYSVLVTNDGLAPYGVTLSTGTPNAALPANAGARVKATGSLSLLFDSANDKNVVISFTGTLNTTHSTSVQSVVVASFD